MQHECRITVLETKCFADYQEQYLADPKSGTRPVIFKIERIDIPETAADEELKSISGGDLWNDCWAYRDNSDQCWGYMPD